MKTPFMSFDTRTCVKEINDFKYKTIKGNGNPY